MSWNSLSNKEKWYVFDESMIIIAKWLIVMVSMVSLGYWLNIKSNMYWVAVGFISCWLGGTLKPKKVLTK